MYIRAIASLLVFRNGVFDEKMTISPLKCLKLYNRMIHNDVC